MKGEAYQSGFFFPIYNPVMPRSRSRSKDLQMNYYSTKQEPKGTKIMTAEAQKSRC
jgi:hypothetical protein